MAKRQFFEVVQTKLGYDECLVHMSISKAPSQNRIEASSLQHKTPHSKISRTGWIENG